jgi:hypothetical protein
MLGIGVKMGTNKMEWRCSVNNCFQAIYLDCFIESTFLCDVLYDLEPNLSIWVCLSNLVGFGLGADSSSDFMAVLKQNIKDVGSDKA